MSRCFAAVCIDLFAYVGGTLGQQSIAEEEVQDSLGMASDGLDGQLDGVGDAPGSYHDILETWRGS